MFNALSLLDCWRCDLFDYTLKFAQVMEAEQERTRSEAEHRKTAANYNSCISHMRQLEKKLKRSINKSRFVFFCMSFLTCSESTPALASVSVEVREREVWWSPDVSWAVLGCAPVVGAKECDRSLRRIKLLQWFSSDSKLQYVPPTQFLSLSFSPCRPYFELKSKYYLQLEVWKLSCVSIFKLLCTM